MTEYDHIWDYRNPYEWMQRVRKSSLPPLIICCATSGGVQGKEANPNIPETAEEQAEQTYEAYKAGAVMVHVHARNPEKIYESASDKASYLQLNRMIRERCPDIIINNTSSGTWGMPIEERLACLDAGPELASLNLAPDMHKFGLRARKPPLMHPRPEVFFDGCSPTTYQEIAALAEGMRERGIKPELEMYNPGDYWVVHDLINQNLLDPPYCIQFVMGYQTSSYPTLTNLLGLIGELPAPSIFTVIGIGPFQIPMTTTSILLGGHVRVGMEDNIYYSRGRLLKSNAEAVERVVRTARELNREIASPAEAREMLGLSQTPSEY